MASSLGKESVELIFIEQEGKPQPNVIEFVCPNDRIGGTLLVNDIRFQTRDLSLTELT